MHSNVRGLVADPLLNLLDEAFAETTTDGTLLRFNSRLLQLLPDLRSNLIEALPRDFLARLGKPGSPLRETITGESTLPSGFDVRISATPLSDSGELRIGWTFRDITAARRQEDELRRQVEKLEFVLEGAGLGSWDWNLTNNEVSFDPLWCEMLGLDHRTTPMRLDTWEVRVHPDDKARAYEDVGAHIEGRTRQYENVHRIRHADGRWIWILDKGKITERDPSGKPMRFSGIHLDISAQKLAEEELHSSRELLDLATSIFQVGVWEWNIEARALRWHSSMFQLFGFTDDGSEGLADIFRKSVSPQHLEPVSRQFYQCIEAGTTFVAEYPIIRKDGAHRTILSKGFIQRDATGKPQRMIGLNWDVTEERQRQQQVEDERMMSLHASRMATLGEMAGGIAHEINSPLAVITMRASQLRDYISRKTPDPATIGLLTETIESTALRIGRIVLAMKNLSRDSSHDSMATTLAADVLHDAALIVQERFRLNSIDLQVRIEPQDLSLYCQPTEISQAILNLLQNARDALEEAAEKWIRIDVSEGDGMAIFEVTDSGAGIPREHQEQLFRPFFTTKPRGRGTGLGLGICRQIAEKHGGSIEYVQDSTHTQFRMRLPIVPPRMVNT